MTRHVTHCGEMICEREKRPLYNKVAGDARLTPFQKKVLLATMLIPRGETRSYAWVARRASSPGASRAAGQALKKNPYAPHVPCHRVIASDGGIGGYSRGIGKKKRLLKEEGAKFCSW